MWMMSRSKVFGLQLPRIRTVFRGKCSVKRAKPSTDYTDLQPTARGFLPSKVLDCIIVATECHEKYQAHLRQCYGRLRLADAGLLIKVAAARASTSRQSL